MQFSFSYSFQFLFSIERSEAIGVQNIFYEEKLIKANGHHNNRIQHLEKCLRNDQESRFLIVTEFNAFLCAI